MLTLPDRLTRFEWFEQGYGQQALQLGIISPSQFQKYIAFKYYLDYRHDGFGKMEAVAMVAAELKISEIWAFKAVSFFVKPRTEELL